LHIPSSWSRGYSRLGALRWRKPGGCSKPYRIVTDRVAGFDQLRTNSKDPYGDVVELALTLATHG